MARERPGHTLQTTALANEAYLRLVDQKRAHWKNRAHFFAIAAQLMRRILIDYARKRGYAKRGGKLPHIPMDEAAVFAHERASDLVALDEALNILGTLDPQQSRVVELRFFGGLTVKETAEVLHLSVDRVKREWATAKAWLLPGDEQGQSMKAERWAEVKELLYAALEREPNDRARFLKEVCRADDGLLEEVKALLVSYERGESFFEKPMLEVASAMLAHDQDRTLVGQTLGHYRVLSSIGTGGMGEVYLAEDTRLGRNVALKLLLPQYTQDQNRLRRFKQEARAASSLNHPNILTIYEIGEVNDTQFIATEFIQGETLRDRSKRSRLGIKETLEVAIQIASALYTAHQAGIVHRDIKPENIMVRRDGYVKVLDFGLAKLTENRITESEAPTLVNTAAGIVMGTARYMSPEQARGLAVDARTDIWSLGVVIYEMIAGRTPFGGETATDTIVSIVQKEPPPLSDYVAESPVELERIVRKCLCKNRDERYPSAQELLTDLKNVQRDLDTAAVSAAVIKKPVRPMAFASWHILAAVGAAIVLVIAAIFYISLFRGAPPPASPEIKSLAVLPLDNLSGDPAQDYFADGMTEALIADLAKIGALRVISRTSVMQYKGARRPLPEIARELNVDAVIEGSVQRSGDRVRITAQLIHAPTDRHLWTGSYERALRDVLALQSEVARTIAGEIRVKLAPQEQVRLARARQVSPEAYDYFLRGSFYINRGSEADWQKAIEMLERAVAIDPSFAEAWANLALAYQYVSVSLKPEEKQWQERAFVAMEKAFSLNPELAEAHIVRGRLLWTHANHYQHEEAIREYRHALSTNPNSDEALFQIGQVYIHIGLFDKALEEFQKAVAINPNNVRALSFFGQTFLYQGKYEDALTAFRNIPDYNPHMNGYQTAWALSQLGKKDEALSTLDKYLRDYPKDPAGTLVSMQAIIFASSGERAKAEERIKVAAEKDRDSLQFHHAAYNIGAAYALMNNPEQAVKWLQTAAEDGFPCYPVFEKDPNLNNIRQEHRFIEFMAKLRNQWNHYQSTL